MKLKKVMASLLAIGLLSTAFVGSASANKDSRVVEIYKDGYPIVSPIFTEQPPIIVKDRVLVPLRVVSEAFKSQVQWNGSTRVVTIKNTIKNETYKFTINKSAWDKNGVPITLDSPAIIKNNRTLVPLRAIGEMYGKVEWDQANYKVMITSDEAYKEKAPVFKDAWDKAESIPNADKFLDKDKNLYAKETIYKYLDNSDFLNPKVYSNRMATVHVDKPNKQYVGAIFKGMKEKVGPINVYDREEKWSFIRVPEGKTYKDLEYFVLNNGYEVIFVKNTGIKVIKR